MTLQKGKFPWMHVTSEYAIIDRGEKNIEKLIKLRKQEKK